MLPLNSSPSPPPNPYKSSISVASTSATTYSSPTSIHNDSCSPLTMSSPPWTTLSELKCKNVSIPIQINDTEFVVSPNSTSGAGYGGLYKYNTTDRKWELFITYPTKLFSSHFFKDYSATFDSKNQMIYLVGGQADNIISVDLNSQKITTFKTKNKIGCHPTSLFYDGTLNVFGGSTSKSHNTWNAAHHSFKQVAIMKDWKQCNTCCGSVYIQSKQCVFVFGGYDYGDTNIRLNGIWKYDITANKWHRPCAVLPYRMDSFGWILTKNEKYVIIFGGAVNEEEKNYTGKWSDNILIWNIESMVVSLSNIKCPMGALFNAVIMSNDDIHIHRVFDGLGHWKINVKDIVVDDELMVDAYVRNILELNIPNDISCIVHFYYIRITNL